MADRDYDRGRDWRSREYGRDRDFANREYYDRDYYNDRNYYGRSYYDRGYYSRNYGDRDLYGGAYGDRDNYGRAYDRDVYDRNFYDRGYYGGRRYETDYDSDYEYDDSGYGPYTGVGPRSYQRSDERIKEDVNDRLTWHGNVDATDIEVSVDDGVVTLNGSVDTRWQKRMAEDAAESVTGVRDINNRLSIRNRDRWTSPGRMEQTQTGQTQGRQIREGMEVVGRNNNNVGQVKKVRANDFLVDRPMARDVYVPFNAGRLEGDRFQLNIEAGEVDNQGWEMPDLIEEPS